VGSSLHRLFGWGDCESGAIVGRAIKGDKMRTEEEIKQQIKSMEFDFRIARERQGIANRECKEYEYKIRLLEWVLGEVRDEIK